MLLNFASYTHALGMAEKDAVHYQHSRVVVWWPQLNKFGNYSLAVHTLCADADATSIIVASVDHTGMITESRWMKLQISEAIGQ
jgi:hypothetical protein